MKKGIKLFLILFSVIISLICLFPKYFILLLFTFSSYMPAQKKFPLDDQKIENVRIWEMKNVNTYECNRYNIFLSRYYMMNTVPKSSKEINAIILEFYNKNPFILRQGEKQFLERLTDKDIIASIYFYKQSFLLPKYWMPSKGSLDTPDAMNELIGTGWKSRIQEKLDKFLRSW